MRNISFQNSQILKNDFICTLFLPKVFLRSRKCQRHFRSPAESGITLALLSTSEGRFHPFTSCYNSYKPYYNLNSMFVQKWNHGERKINDENFSNYNQTFFCCSGVFCEFSIVYSINDFFGWKITKNTIEINKAVLTM